MEYEFLRRLFASCSEEPDNGFRVGMNLSELYEHIEETKKQNDAFSRAIEFLDRKKQTELESASCEVGDAHELQGFINGFRLCWMLQRETATAWYGQQAPELKEGDGE